MRQFEALGMDILNTFKSVQVADEASQGPHYSLKQKDWKPQYPICQ